MSLTLWSDKPVAFPEHVRDNMRASAVYWEKQVFPLGNGRLGCTVFGDPVRERLQFNEDSLWVGNEDCTGGYQPFGDIHIEFPFHHYHDYRRELDLQRAVQTVTYASHGVRYTREVFASHPAQVIVARFTADQPAALSGKVTLGNLHEIPTTAEGRTLSMIGRNDQLFFWKLHLQERHRILADRQYASDKIIELDFIARVRVLHEGGTVRTVDDAVVFEGCDSVTLLLAADTNYLNRRDQGWRFDGLHERIERQLDAAEARSYDDLLAEHVADYRSLFARLTLDLGPTPAEAAALPTAQRLARYRDQFASKGAADDRGLETLLYQYARCMMISCSRSGEGALPANLQGLWLFNLRPAWRCDYHTDINVQMNYWFVDQANLAECFVPLAEWVNSIRDVRKEETRRVLGVERGWLMRSENNIFGGSTWHIQKGDSAWLCQNLWDHYAFTRDKAYLREYAYPVMKEISEFWVDHLKALPDGTLVAPDGRSPEHGPVKADGVSYDQQLCWDLFSNTIEASVDLEVDPEFRAELEAKRDKLLGPRVGRWGQLQEWMEDIDDPQCDHRHVSHMIAVHPGRQIDPVKTPVFAEAAKVSVLGRRGESPGWSLVWKSCIFARLFEPEHAYRMLSEVLRSKTHANLWTVHPPFQIDCNFGYAAAVHEMLVQSHTGTIRLLPALPAAWPDGSVRGMRVRGGYELDMTWAGGRLQEAVLRGVCNDTDTCTVQYGPVTTTLRIPRGEEVRLPTAAPDLRR